jgi:hypothetical protein
MQWRFNTNSSWGALGSKTAPFNFTTPDTLVFDNNCLNPLPKTPPPQCVKDYAWSAPPKQFVSGGQQIVETNGGGHNANGGTAHPDYISASRFVQLATPKAATRIDIVSEPAPAPTLSNKTLSITTSPGATLITGAASIIEGGSLFPSTSPCKAGGVKKTQTSTLYYGSTWANNAVKPVTVNMAVGGSFSIHSGPSATMSVETFA